MARFLVLAACFIDGARRRPGAEVDLPEGTASSALRPLDPPKVAKRADPPPPPDAPRSAGEGGEVEIPANWQALHHFKRIALAHRLAKGKTKPGKVEADKIIAAEVERRAAQ